ncbi:MAG: hypothetical protein ABH952_10720 [Candidatus Omnitrophota bacterium]
MSQIASNGDMFEVFRVGKPVSDNFNAKQGLYYEYSLSGHICILCLPNLTSDEIDSFENCDIEFRFTEILGIIYFLVRFSEFTSWSDAPYSWHIVDDNYKDIPLLDIPHGEGACLFLILVDSSDKLIKKTRLIGLGHDFTLGLHSLIIRQSKTSFHGIDLHLENCKEIENNYSPEDLAKLAMYSFKIKGRNS